MDELMKSGNTWEVAGNGNGKLKDCPQKELK